MSQLKNTNNTKAVAADVEDDEIIANLEILMNYESLEQIESWEVLMDTADMETLIETHEKNEAEKN